MNKFLSYFTVISLALGLTGCGNNTGNTKSNKDAEVNPDDNEVYITSRDSELRISPSDKLKFEEYEHTSERQPIVFVNEKVTFQTIEGIGGAITDAAAETYYKLPEDKRNEIIGAYFGAGKGIGLSLSLIHISEPTR